MSDTPDTIPFAVPCHKCGAPVEGGNRHTLQIGEDGPRERMPPICSPCLCDFLNSFATIAAELEKGRMGR